MLYYDKIDRSKAIDPTKSNRSKECMIYHYWFFNHGFKFQDFVCNGCHDLAMLSVNTKQLIYWRILYLKIVGIYKHIVLIFDLLKTVFFNFFVLVYIKGLIVNIVWASIYL